MAKQAKTSVPMVGDKIKTMDNVDDLKKTGEYHLTAEMCADPEWRMDNLYRIIDENGAEIPFKRNEAQSSYWRNRHSRDVIPKARQLGFSTLIELAILDTCIFRSNIKAGIVDNTLDDAKVKLEKVAFAYDGLPVELRQGMPTTKRNTEEIHWANGSSVSVGTSYRGGTAQILHSSELGKTSVDKPDAAREWRLGSMPSVHQRGWAIIESTCHGTSGEFYDYVKKAENIQKLGRKLTPLDFKLHFHGWWMKASYRLPNNLIVITQELRDYFNEVAPILASRYGIRLDANQMAWYASMYEEWGPDDVKSEYPTILEETFYNSKAGAYWKKEIAKARAEKRIGLPVPHDPTRLVNTWWDIGEDCTAIIFHQTDGVRHRVIDYYEEVGGSLQASVGVLDDKRRLRGFKYGVHLGPHDLDNRDWANNAQSRYKTALDLGIKFTVVPRVEVKADSIEAGRRMLGMLWICQEHAGLLVDRCENYSKKWNKSLQVFSPDPVHDMNSHGPDALQGGAMGQHLDPSLRVPREQSRPRLDKPKTSAWAS